MHLKTQIFVLLQLELQWENRGAAPAYHDYRLLVQLEGPDVFDFDLAAGNRKWLPRDEGTLAPNRYPIRLPESAKPGEYTLKLKLYSSEANRDVLIALKDHFLDKNGYYKITNVTVGGR